MIAELPEAMEVQTKRRMFTLKKGFYAYVGSAMNNLEARIARHVSRDKKRHWHTDYLLDHAQIKTVIWAQTETQAECQLAQSLSEMTVVAGFGCSDCRCPSHLFHASEHECLTERTLEGFKSMGLKPVITPI